MKVVEILLIMINLIKVFNLNLLEFKKSIIMAKDKSIKKEEKKKASTKSLKEKEQKKKAKKEEKKRQ